MTTATPVAKLKKPRPRLLPPAASKGQCGKKIELSEADLGENEAAVLAALKAARAPLPLADLAARAFGGRRLPKTKANSWTRNALRRLVRGRLVVRAGAVGEGRGKRTVYERAGGARAADGGAGGMTTSERKVTAKEKREREVRLRVLAKVRDAGATGTFIANTGQWLKAERMADEGLLRRAQAVQRVATMADGSVRTTVAPKFWITNVGEAILAAATESTSKKKRP